MDHSEDSLRREFPRVVFDHKEEMLMLKETLRLLLVTLWIPFGAAVAQWTNDTTSNTPVCRASGDQTYVQIASDGSGGAIFVWQDNRSGTWNIYAQRIDSSGVTRWQNNGILVCNADNAQSPQILADGAGGAFITWFDLRGGWPVSGIYVQRVSASGELQWQANGIALTDTASSYAYPMIAPDGTGGAVIAWIGYNGETYVQKINSAGESQWTAEGVLASGGGEVPQVVSDGAGGAILTWYKYDASYMHTDIFAQRVSDSGKVEWNPAPLPICEVDGYQLHPTLVPDDSGGAIIAWLDNRGSEPYVYAQRVSPDGKIRWEANGIKVGTHNASHRVRIMRDGAGGAITAWPDQSGGRTFAQRVSRDGELLWPGDAAVSPTDNGGYPRFAANAASDPVLVWEGYVALDLRAQHLNGDGSLALQVQGVAVATGSYYKSRHSFILDGRGSVIVTWEDNRGYNTDIFAQRLYLALSVTGVETWSGVPENFVLEQNYPNPFNPSTTIGFMVPDLADQHAGANKVRLAVCDVLGREVAVLVDEAKAPGWYHVRFDASRLSSGVYFYILTAGELTRTRTMVYVK